MSSSTIEITSSYLSLLKVRFDSTDSLPWSLPLTLTLPLRLPLLTLRSFVCCHLLHVLNQSSSLLLGHLSREALAAAALSDLWTMTTSVLLSGRILGVLVGGAVGAGNPKLAGET